MYTFIVIVILIVAVLLMLVVLAQNSKGGGLTGGAGNQVIGAQRATDWIEKATWTLASVLFALCLLINVFIDRGGQVTGSPNQEKAKEAGAIPSGFTTPTDTETTDGS